jgi:uncharacterized protein DUF4339
MYKIIGGDQKEYGPVSAEDVRHWIAEGRLNAQSLAQAQVGGGWRPLGDFPEFAEALRLQAAAQPAAGTPPPVSNQTWAAQLLAAQPQLSIGRCLASSWNLLTQNFGLLFGASFLVWLVNTVSQWVPLVGGLCYLIIRGVMLGGLYLVVLRRIRGQAATVGDAFAGFNVGVLQLILVGFVSAFFSLIGLACCLVIPGLYLWIAWIFSVPLVADRKLEFWSAMELSRKMVTRVWFEVLALVLLAFLPSILMYIAVEVKIMATTISTMRDIMGTGQPDFMRMFSAGLRMAKANLPLLLLWKVVVLFNLPFAVGALMYAYENLFGPRTTSAP